MSRLASANRILSSSPSRRRKTLTRHRSCSPPFHTAQSSEPSLPPRPQNPHPRRSTTARALDAAFPALTSALATVMFFDFLGQLPDLGTTAPAETATHQVVVLPVAATATAALFAAVGLVFRHIHNAAAGRGDRRVSDLVTSMLCVSAGTLQYVFFVQPAGVVINLGGALGLAAAAVTFFIGMATVLAHVCAGGGAAAGDAPVVRILSTVALGAAAALVVGIGIAALNTGTG